MTDRNHPTRTPGRVVAYISRGRLMDPRFYLCNGDPDALSGHYFVNVGTDSIVWECTGCGGSPT